METRKDLTVVYYTSNREDEQFEQKIRARIWEAKAGLPLVSVSQKPIMFGHNVCVGDIGTGEAQICKQICIGCEVALTPWVIFCEADTLYPPEYFMYTPDDMNKRYWFEGVYIFKPGHPAFYNKGRSDVAHMAGREYILKLLHRGMDEHLKSFYGNSPRPTRIDLTIPVVSVKTGRGMRSNTQTNEIPTPELPYWGTAQNLKKELGL